MIEFGKMRSKMCLIFLFLSLTKGLAAQNTADDIIGIWLTTGKDPAKIQIYKDGDKFFGKIIWLQNPLDNSGKPKTDINNPDQNKKSIPVIGLVILNDFRFNGQNEWSGGTIYDPESGKTYSSYMSLKDKNTVNVRGYVGLSLFGRTEAWTRTQ